jgi:hypothetical protein
MRGSCASTEIAGFSANRSGEVKRVINPTTTAAA